MQTYHAKPLRSPGWLLGITFFLLTAFYPSLPSIVPYNGYDTGWSYDFFHLGAAGGVGTQIFSYFFLRRLPYIMGFVAGRTIFMNFALYSFLPIILPLCILLTWRLLVYRASHPTIARGILAVLIAFVLSLVLIFLLDEIGGRALLYVLALPGNGSVEARSMMAGAWTVATVQSAWFLLPCLLLGGLAAWWQESRWRSYMHQVPKDIRAELPASQELPISAEHDLLVLEQYNGMNE